MYFKVVPEVLRTVEREKVMLIGCYSFFQYFHPHFPILNEELQPLEYHERSPLLFWTVIVIAARAYRERPSLHTDLSKPVTDLLWTKISAIPPSHFTIQAEMLLCIWPFSPRMLIADNTLFMASIVKAGCTQLGLHQPENMQDYNRIRFQILKAHVEEAVKLWAACFITAERSVQNSTAPCRPA